MLKTRTKPRPTIAYNPLSQGRYRFVEHASRGLRLVGFADTIVRLNHTGWYTDSDYSTLMRGVVYQLPSRKGCTQYLAGYADPWNDDAAFLCMDIEHDKEDAARFADRIAEIYAEKERDYQDAWRAALDAKEKAQEARDHVRAEIEMLRELGDITNPGAAIAFRCYDAALDAYRDTMSKLGDALIDAKRVGLSYRDV